MDTNGGEKPLGNPKKQKNPKCGDQWELENHWEIQKNKKKTNVDTNGGEKPLGNPKKTKKNKCGHQWGRKTIGKYKKKTDAAMDRTAHASRRRLTRSHDARIAGISAQIIDERNHLRGGKGVAIYRCSYKAENQDARRLK